jgi:ATP-dependent protease ClpP protease subunit
MPKQILLYGSIDSYSANEFNEAIQEMELAPDEELMLRINTPGGSPEYGWGIISMFKDLPNVKKIKVDGQAHSMGAFILCYVKEAEALDVSEFLIHRAAYSDWFERSEYFTEATKDNLVRVNKSLEAAFRAKVDVAMFEEMKGVKVKDLFSMDGRIDVYLTAKEAKKIGLISKVIALTAESAKEVEAYAKAANSGKGIFVPKVVEESIEKTSVHNQNKNKMTAAEIKAAHPAEYAAIQNEAITAERDRVGALLAFHDVDPKGIMEAIKKGESLNATMTAELTRKSIAKAAVKGVEDDSAKDIDTADQGTDTAKEAAKKADEKALADFSAEAIAHAKKQII